MRILVDGQTFHTAEINRGIGVYFISVLQKLLEGNFTDEFYLTVGDSANINKLSKWCQGKVNIIENECFNPSSLLQREGGDASKIYGEKIESVTKAHNIDTYWNPNPLMDNVFLPLSQNSVKYTATIHDLIPLVMKNVYFKIWSEEKIKEYYEKLNALRNYDLLFSVSGSTKNDIATNLDVNENKIKVTYEGVADHFRPYCFSKIVSSKEYLLYTGGFDPRKNMESALNAFAEFLKRYNTDNKYDDLKFIVVCHYDEDSKNRFLKRVNDLQLDSQVGLVGYVSDSELVKLYQKAACFFFPSLYEGFGLPVVEALACGTSVACSKVASLTEFDSDSIFYFDPNSISEMADAINLALNASKDYNERINRHNQVKKYSWRCVSSMMDETFQKLVANHSIQFHNKSKRIAWLSPLPPQKSGIANYSDVILSELKSKADIDLYYDNEKPVERITNEFNVYHLSEFESNKAKYDSIFYNIGNNSDFHENIYKLAWNNPGIVILHDLNIHPFLQQSFLGKKEEGYYIEALEYSVGRENAEMELENIRITGFPDVFRNNMSDAIINKSKLTIVHNRWCKNQVTDNENIKVVPHFAKISYIPSQTEITDYRKKLRISDNQFILTCMGFINKNKLPMQQVEVVNRLRKAGYAVTLLFAGELSGEVSIMFKDVSSIDFLNNVIVTGFQEMEDYYRALYVSDLILNLRNPSLGETSGTFMQALAAGKVILVSDGASYKEIPDNVCWKVPFENNEEHLYEYLKYLLSNPGARSVMSKNAKEYSKLFTAEKLASRYIELVSS